MLNSFIMLWPGYNIIVFMLHSILDFLFGLIELLPSLEKKNEGIYTHRLTPSCPVEFGKRTGTLGDAILKLPTEDSLTYQAMDLIYQHVEGS
jgi:hypothetical protein